MAVVALTLAWHGWRPQASVAGRVAPAVPPAGVAEARHADFPWHLGAAPAAEPVRAGSTAAGSDAPSDRRFSRALSAGFLTPPARPVWEMLRGYPGPSVTGIAPDMELLAALTFCEGSLTLPRTLWEGRSQGTMSPEQLQQLDARHTQAASLCARLSHQD